MEQIKQIIDKVRQMYKYDKRIKDIVSLPASIRVQEYDGEILIEGIIFGAEDLVTVTRMSHSINYFNYEKNEWEKLIEFKDFEDLLNM